MYVCSEGHCRDNILMPQIVILIKQKIIAFFVEKGTYANSGLLYTYMCGLILICTHLSAGLCSWHQWKHFTTYRNRMEEPVWRWLCDSQQVRRHQGERTGGWWFKKRATSIPYQLIKFFYFENWNHHHVDINIFFCNFQRLSNKPNLRFPT